MKRFNLLPATLLCLLLTGVSHAQSQSASPPPAWPRTYTNGTDSAVMYAPQVDAWQDQQKIRFRAAIVVAPASTGRSEYGVVAVQANTIVDHDARMVLMTNLDVAVRFPGMPDDQAAPLKSMVRQLLPQMSYLDVSLDQVVAHLKPPPDMPKVSVNLDPPPIYYSNVPAVLVIYVGAPQFKPIKDTKLMFAANTNWLVMMDMTSGQYYLLNDGSWLTATDPLKGPWTAAKSLPAEFSKLPADGSWSEVLSNIPGKPAGVVPRVITSTTPAELILTQGPPEYTPIGGTRLMYVSNPQMPVFLDLIDGNYYLLASGRWFRAPGLAGPWTAASTNLPAEFVKIPSDSPMGFVLASIPNTQEAQDAILLASIPHKATISIGDAKLAVTYDGAPKFAPIQGTSMTFAVNTSYQVVLASGQYYCCYQGVWFVSPAATGPWAVCTSVPGVIYTIPPTSPIYNCTYVKVYSTTPTTVVVGYTSGYSGEYVAATGALMFGAGMLVGAAIAENNNWYACSPCYYSYGSAAHYSYAAGGYYRTGAACYGPAGGAGWTAGYNPTTGTYARSAAAYGPAGSVHATQAYNPWTNTYAQHTGGTNGYKSWGSSYVQQGNNAAVAQHESTARGSVGSVQTSSGNWAEAAHSNVTNSSVAKTSNGDYYAGHDGNVYKNTGDGWQKYDGSGKWTDTSYNKTTAQETAQADRSSWQSNASQDKSNWQNNSSQWKSDFSSDNSQLKSSWENRSSSSSDAWSQHDTLSGLNSDSFSRNNGANNAFSSFQSRSSGEAFGGAQRGGVRGGRR